MRELAILRKMQACESAICWVEECSSWAEAWTTCGRADWMLWVLVRICGKSGSDAHRRLVLAACRCARISLGLVRPGELRPLAAIEIAERWARRQPDVTLDMVRMAAAAADAAADAATDARIKALKQCADIVREFFPEPPVLV